MASSVEVKVPDIGGFKDVSVIDVLVKTGQSIDKETPLITIETEKAAMDVPAPASGKIAEIKIKAGDKVSEGSVILLLEGSGGDAAKFDAAATHMAAPAPAANAAVAPAAEPPREKSAEADSKTAPPHEKSPDADSKAASREKSADADSKTATREKSADADSKTATREKSADPDSKAASPSPLVAIDESGFSKSHASPSVRRFARETGANLADVKGSGIKARITHEDVKAHIKRMLSAAPATRAAGGLPKLPVVDFASFGPIEIKPLSRIQKISGARLQASWINIPHVTQYEDADITDLEALRNQLKSKAQQEGVRLTPLAFIVRACIIALKEHPRFNASLDPGGDTLVYKKYFNIGFAADTENGLVVPVIRNADRLNLFGIAHELGELSERARAGKLKAAEMQGGTFTISSLGSIGGTAFTPIINAPEVAILGIARSSLRPVYERGAFIPRLILPLALSYDHRVIDGAAGARFVVSLAKVLGDVGALQ